MALCNALVDDTAADDVGLWPLLLGTATAFVAGYAPNVGDQVTQLWRSKQLEYTWLRSLMGAHADFRQVTRDGLAFALAFHGVEDVRTTLLTGPDEVGARRFRTDRGRAAPRRVTRAGTEALEAIFEDIRRDRERSYAALAKS